MTTMALNAGLKLTDQTNKEVPLLPFLRNEIARGAWLSVPLLSHRVTVFM